MTNSFIDKKIQELEILSSNSKFWNITKEQGEFLSSLVLKKQPKNILEIGNSNGYSTLHLIKNLNINSKLTTIEVNDERLNAAKKNLKKLSCKHKRNRFYTAESFSLAEPSDHRKWRY